MPSRENPRKMIWLLLAFLSILVGYGTIFLVRDILVPEQLRINYFYFWGGLSLVGCLLFIPMENRFLWMRSLKYSYIELLGQIPPLTFGFFCGTALGVVFFDIGAW